MFQNIFFKQIQLCFRDKRDKDTALIKITSDPLLAADAGESSALIPSDLSSASDTAEHAVLIDWLKFWLASLKPYLFGLGCTSNILYNIVYTQKITFLTMFKL